MTDHSDRDIQLEILAELKRLNAAVASASRSSVELATAGVKNAVGDKLELKIKAYEGSPIDEPATEAIAGFAVVYNEVKRRQLDDWAETVNGLQTAAD